MSKKNRIFAAAIAVLFLALTSMSTFAGFRLYFYELDFKYDEKRQTFSFTSVADATYYEIRGFAPGETISNTTGVLLGTYTPSTVSTGHETYDVSLRDVPRVIDEDLLAKLKLKPYYTLVVFSYRTTPIMHNVTVTANYCDVSVYSDGVLLGSSGGTYQVQDGSSISVTFHDRGNFKTYYGDYTITHGGIDITGPEYGLSGSNKLQGVYGDDFYSFTVNNIYADVVISMTAKEPPAPDHLDTPVISQSGDHGEIFSWDPVEDATEYNVEVYKSNNGSNGGTMITSQYVTSTSFDVGGYYQDDDYYYFRIRACYCVDRVVSAWNEWYCANMFLAGPEPSNAPADLPVVNSSAVATEDLSAVDYSSSDTDPVCNGESNPLTFIGTGSVSEACKKPHIVDKNGDGYDDASFDAGVTYQTNSSGDSGVSDFITKILGAVTGSAIYIGSNVKIAGISLLTIAGILAVGVAIVIIFSFKKGS